MTPQRNWSGHVTFAPARAHEPESIDELVAIVRAARKIRVVGSAHSFNAICDTDGDLVSLARLAQPPRIDADERTVTVSAGMRYGELALALDAAGWALHNMASLPHIGIAGAIATATHGSGDRNGNLATAVRAFELVTANGALRRCSRATDGDAFDGMVVSLGALGVVTSLTLAIEPAYQMRQTVYENLPVAQRDSAFDAIMSSAYSVSLFTTWNGASVDQVWVKQREADPTVHVLGLAEALGATRRLHPLAGVSAEACTEQLGIPGPWHERLPHFRLDHTPSGGDELQTEYFVPRSHAVDALRALNALGDQIRPALFVSEIRTVARDDLWLSPSYECDSVGLHFTWKNDWPRVRALLPVIERALAPFDPRPHWGKLFTMPPSVIAARYPRFDAFRHLRAALDPDRKFVNAFVADLLHL
jgi:alditol oxidase